MGNGKSRSDWKRYLMTVVDGDVAKRMKNIFSWEKMKQQRMHYYWLVGSIVGLIGLVMSVKCCFAYYDTKPAQIDDEAMCSETTPDKCPWSHVFSDMSNRLQLLELAFKEQVIAREVITQEVHNQSDFNILLDKKIEQYLNRLEDVRRECRRVEDKVNDIQHRMRSDESLGYLVVVFIIVEIIVKIRGQLKKYLTLSFFSKKKEPEVKKEAVVTTPKASNGTSFRTVKCDLCVVTFRNDNNNVHSARVDTMLRHFDDKLPVKPYMVIENHDQLRHLPNAKLFLVIIDCDVSGDAGKQFEVELRLATIKAVKSSGAPMALVVASDEGSRKLTAHTMYNVNLRLVQSHQIFQELGSQGKLFTVWQDFTSHQLSHLRKITRSALITRHSSCVR